MCGCWLGFVFSPVCTGNILIGSTLNLVFLQTFICRSDSEKRQIWLYESLVLFVLSLLIYVFHHTPYALLLFSVLTLLYTQLVGRVDFG